MRLGGVPAGVEAVVLLSVEELAVNELRETYHHWIRTLAFPVRSGRLGEPLPHRPAVELRGGRPTHDGGLIERARKLLDEVEPALKDFLRSHRQALTADLEAQLELDGEQARRQEEERYRSRQGEVSSLIADNTLARLEREIAALQQEKQQGRLFDEEGRLDSIERSIEDKQEELARRTRHYEEVREQLDRERQRILGHLLPRRYAMRSESQVFPVVIEVRLPGGPP